MKLAFCLFRYFPFGGLQRDFIRIAHECLERGHEVHVFTMTWQGDHEPGLNLHILRPKGLTNHGKARNFIKLVHAQLQAEHYDLVVGFNKMPGLDVYYAADVCYKARKESESFLYKLSPRYREWVRQEQAIFAESAKTEILLISERQEAAFRQSYHTEANRFHLLPPGISRDRMRPDNADDIRKRIRKDRHVGEHEFIILMVGSGFATKGVDRAVRAFAGLPVELKNNSYLYVIGADNPDPYIKLAKKLGADTRIAFLGGRPDVPDFLLAADVMIHPAYYDNTATVLLEAVVAGVPVLTTDKCGYAKYVSQAEAGIVLASPYSQEKFNSALADMLGSSEKRRHWHENALKFANNADIFSMPQRAADLIELIGKRSEFLSRS